MTWISNAKGVKACLGKAVTDCFIRVYLFAMNILLEYLNIV